MKKTIVFGIVFLLSILAVLAIPQPVVTTLGSTGMDLEFPECVYAEGDMYCFGSYINDTYNTMWKYDLDTNIFSVVKSPTTYKALGDFSECFYYGGFIYCLTNHGIAADDSFKIRPDGTEETKLADITPAPDGNDQYGCDLRPGYDQIWCWGSDDNNLLTTQLIRYYDISEDAWYNMGAFGYTDPLVRVYMPNCAFRNANEFWCAGGYGGPAEGGDWNKIMKYDISAATQTITNFPQTNTGYGRWFDNNFYVYASTRWDITNGDVVLYNLDDEAGMELSNALGMDYMVWGSHCSYVNETVDICVGGYTPSGVTQDVYKFEWFDDFDVTHNLPINGETYYGGTLEVDIDFTSYLADINYVDVAVLTDGGSVIFNETVEYVGDGVRDYTYHAVYEGVPLGEIQVYAYIEDDLGGYYEPPMVIVTMDCTPSWSCVGYDDCVSPLPEVSCNNVTDLNECGEAYGGDYSEFNSTICVYPVESESEKRTGGSSSFVIAQQNLAKQAEVQQKPMTLLDALIQVIHNIRKALGLEG